MEVSWEEGPGVRDQGFKFLGQDCMIDKILAKGRAGGLELCRAGQDSVDRGVQAEGVQVVAPLGSGERLHEFGLESKYITSHCTARKITGAGVIGCESTSLPRPRNSESRSQESELILNDLHIAIAESFGVIRRVG